MNKSRVINIVLVCSIALNLLIVGAIIGRVAFGPLMGPPPLTWMMKDLDAETRNRIHTNFEDRAKVVEPMRREIRAAREEFKTLLKEDELDEEASLAALARLRQASAEYTVTLHEQMILMLKDLEPKQRLRVSRFLMRPHPKPLAGSSSGRPDHRQKPPD
jgi:uncharacterized membrane protein